MITKTRYPKGRGKRARKENGKSIFTLSNNIIIVASLSSRANVREEKLVIV